MTKAQITLGLMANMNRIEARHQLRLANGIAAALSSKAGFDLAEVAGVDDETINRARVEAWRQETVNSWQSH